MPVTSPKQAQILFTVLDIGLVITLAIESQADFLAARSKITMRGTTK